MILRDMSRGRDPNRTLVESILVPELITALRDWEINAGGGVLIGGIALSFYVPPRATQDLDFLFLSDSVLPKSVEGFTRTRDHAFQHNLTRVEIELVTPELVGNLPVDLAKHIILTAIPHEGIHIASPSGLVAAKLGRLSMQDRADIIALIKTARVDLTEFPLDQKKMLAYQELVELAKHDQHPK